MQRPPSDTPRIENPAFVEYLGPFGKKLAVFVEAHFKRREVEDLVIGLGFPKVGHQGHVQRKRVVDTVLDVHAPVEGLPRGVGRAGGLVAVILCIARDKGRRLQAEGRTDARYPLQEPRLVDDPRNSRIDRVPEARFLNAPYLPGEVDIPGLNVRFREPQRGVGDFKFRNPTFRGNRGSAFPDGVPAVVVAVGPKLEVHLHPGSSDHEAQGVDSTAIGVEKHTKPVGILRIVALGKFLLNPARVGITAQGTDINTGVIV